MPTIRIGNSRKVITPRLTCSICKRFAGMVRSPDSMGADVPGQKTLGKRDGMEKEAETPVTSVTKNKNVFRALPCYRVFPYIYQHYIRIFKGLRVWESRKRAYI